MKSAHSLTQTSFIPSRRAQQLKKREEKLMYWYAFFMAFPSIVIVFNFNFYIFPVLAVTMYKRYGYFIKPVSKVQLFAFLFCLGAFISTINSYNFDVSLVVLPNYLYWGLIIIFFSSHARNLKYEIIFRALAHGVIWSTLYYFVFQGFVRNTIPISRVMAQNAYAFLTICFAPCFVYYYKKTKGNTTGLVFLIAIILLSIASGSRSSAVLVLLGGVATYYVDRLNIRKGLPSLLGIGLFFIMLNATGIAQFLIKTLNEEAYELIYKSEEVFENDISFLTRVAMIEKGLKIFKENKFDGIGLNMFKKYETDIEGEERWNLLFNFKVLKKGISSHNSYLNLLAEGGLVVIVPYALIVLYILFAFFTNFDNIPEYGKAIMIGMFAMSIHFYFIAAILNVFAWYNIALAVAIATNSFKRN